MTFLGDHEVDFGKTKISKQDAVYGERPSGVGWGCSECQKWARLAKSPDSQGRNIGIYIHESLGENDMVIVEPIYKVSENNPGEWIIAKASDPSFLLSAQGFVRIDDGAYILNFTSEAAALTYAQQQSSLHLSAVHDITAPWRDWPTEHLLRKIEMPEGFVAELRKRLRDSSI